MPVTIPPFVFRSFSKYLEMDIDKKWNCDWHYYNDGFIYRLLFYRRNFSQGFELCGTGLEHFMEPLYERDMSDNGM